MCVHSVASRWHKLKIDILGQEPATGFSSQMSGCRSNDAIAQKSPQATTQGVGGNVLHILGKCKGDLYCPNTIEWPLCNGVVA